MDSFVGGANADTFNGYINTTVGNTTSTLTAADVITGGAGVDTLAITVEGDVGGALPNATINGVEKFSIRDVTTAGASVYDFATVQGETEVTANSSTRAVSFTSLATGTVVGVKGDGINTTGAVTFSMATGTDAVALALNGVKGSAVAATVTGKATSATITTAGAASTTGTITLSDEATALSAGATIKNVTINANADLTIGSAAAGADLIGFDVTPGVTNTITVTGSASKVVLNDVAAAVDVVDASAFAGGVTANANGATLTTFKGGIGADVLTLGALTATGTVDLGAGDDKLLAGAAAAIGSKNLIDGGAGIDSISASLINAANAAVIKNFEKLDLSAGTTTALDVELVTGSTITGLTLNGAGSSTLSNVAAGVGLSIGGSSTGTSTIGVKGALTGTADSFAISFDNATAIAAVPTLANVAVNSVVLNGVETVSIASTGVANSWNSIGLTDTNLQTLNITGDKNLDLTFGAATGTNVVATGGAVKLIDGSAATGKLSINTTNVTADNKVGVGLTVNGGSAADTITLAQKATVVAGAGDDLIVSSAAGGTFTGGAGADKINVVAAVATGVTEATSVLSTITDFSKTDSLVFGATALTFGAAKVTLDASVTNLDLALTAATTTAGQVSWFQYGANTYVVANDATPAFGAGDTVVKLSGLVDLSTGTFDAATHALTA